MFLPIAWGKVGRAAQKYPQARNYLRIGTSVMKRTETFGFKKIRSQPNEAVVI